MLSSFITYIQQEELFRLSRDKILLAVSGGMDSVALVQLCRMAGVKFGIAHCNFQLRDKESNQDAAFVKNLATAMEVPYYNIHFDTNKEAQQQKKSIQVVARDLRYEWLEQVRSLNEYDYIAIAHHHNDSIETLLINLTMGCGIRGLHGILPKNGNIIRPLLFTNRSDIELFMQENGHDFREDSSNASTKYIRNALRHLVIPELKKINPFLETTFDYNFQRFRETEALYNFAITTLKKEWVQEKGEQLWINIEGVANSPAPLSFLHEILHPFQFKTTKIQAIFNRRAEDSGAIYQSRSHQILRDRDYWILSPIDDNLNEQFDIEHLEGKAGQLNFGELQFEWTISNQQPTFERDVRTAHFDFDKLTFPLHLRHWKHGDIIYPLGMEGKKKKLSKFFKDIKMNRFEKDATWLLCNANNDVLWIVGHREDERFRVEASSQKVLSFTYQNL